MTPTITRWHALCSTGLFWIIFAGGGLWAATELLIIDPPWPNRLLINQMLPALFALSYWMTAGCILNMVPLCASPEILQTEFDLTFKMSVGFVCVITIPLLFAIFLNLPPVIAGP